MQPRQRLCVLIRTMPRFLASLVIGAASSKSSQRSNIGAVDLEPKKRAIRAAFFLNRQSTPALRFSSGVRPAVDRRVTMLLDRPGALVMV
jgi:hypothetical protein